MKELAQSSRIKAYDLSGTCYLQSLIEAGVEEHMLCEKEIEVVRLQCMELLADKSQRYANGDSSIRVEAAQNILQSCFYTTGLFLKTLRPDEGVRALKQDGIRTLYEVGRRKLDIKLKTAKHMYAIVLSNMIKTVNITYNETLIGGIKGFFKLYDAEYAAHEIRITADYPLSNPVVDFAGIEFMIEYLKAIALENEFCRKFDPGNIHLTMLAYHKNYESLVINLFDQVLVSAIGCVLADYEPTMLLIPRSNTAGMQSKWLLKTKPEIEAIVSVACGKLLDMLMVSKEDQKRYIKKSLPHISGVIYLAIQTLTLDKVFVGPR